MPVPSSSPYRAPRLLIDRMRPQLEQILEAYRVPEAKAEDLLTEMTWNLLYKWDSITRHDYWLVKTLERRCEKLYGPSKAAKKPARPVS